MASFLYFLPGVDHKALIRDDRLNHEELRRWHLQDVLADCVLIPNHCIVTKLESGGAENQPGIVLTTQPANAAGTIPRVPSYHPESQTWVKLLERENEPWVGWQSDAPPTPEDLERRDSISGYRRDDNHARSWRMPVVRGRVSQYGHLPVDYQWTAESFEPGMVLRKEFEKLWNDSAKIWDHLYVEGFNCAEPFLAGFVARCFAINYRIGPRELEAFRRMATPMFDRSDYNEWASIACDYPAVMQYALQKKMTIYQAARDGTCSTTGDPAGTLNSAQLAASSE